MASKYPDIDAAFAAIRAAGNLTCLAVRTRLRPIWDNRPESRAWLAYFQRACRELGEWRAWQSLPTVPPDFHGPDAQLFEWWASRECVTYCTHHAVMSFQPEDGGDWFICQWRFVRHLYDN